MQGDQYTPVQFVIGEGVIGPGGVAFAINERVVAHIFVAQTARLQNGTHGALELGALPASIQKAMIVRIVRITADEIRPRSRSIQSNYVGQGGLEQQRFVRRSEIVQVQ